MKSSAQGSSATALPESATQRAGLRRGLSWFAGKIRFPLWKRYLFFLLFLVAWGRALGWQSGLMDDNLHLPMELPLVLALYWAVGYALRPGKLSAWVAAVPFALIYLIEDIYYIAYRDPVRIASLQNLPELLRVLPLAGKAGVLLALGLPVLLPLTFANYKRPRRVLSIGALFLLGAVCLELFPGFYLQAMQVARVDEALFSNSEMVIENGRITSLLFFEANRRSALKLTAAYRQRGEYEQQVGAAAKFLQAQGNGHNVHLIVLESWLDPTLLRGVTYSRSPWHPDFARLVGDRMSDSISPVFGGITAQAEFEALCGVPALAKLAENEFVNFTGTRVDCMPGILRRAGYATYSSNAWSPSYFNSLNAYPGMGFEHLNFPREYTLDQSSYLSVASISPQEEFLFDGDLFRQNLAFVTRTIHEHPDKPIFNYVLTAYGHNPEYIDTQLRPMVLSMNAPHDDPLLLRAANQYWYRTQAIAEYVNGLIKADPQSLIILVSDHLPTLSEGIRSYRDFRYLDNADDSVHTNRLLIIQNGVAVQHKTIHHYEIPLLVYEYLTGNRYCEKYNCHLTDSELKDKYMMLISRAVYSK